MRLRAVTGALVAATFVCMSSGASLARATTPPGAGGQVVEVPVAFQVTNTDTSGAPCNPARPSDGKPYTVRGHLAGPRAALATPASVTLYLFGYEAGEWNWDLKLP